jgi:predicted RNA-binding Zn ribbon-like protein
MGAMPFQFQLVAGHPALDFANTLDYRFDPERTIELMSSYERLAEFTRQSGLITEHQARRLKLLTDERGAEVRLKLAIQLREVIEALFHAILNNKAPGEVCLRDFNRFVARARRHEKIYWKSGKVIRGFDEVAQNVELPIWLLTESAVALLMSPELTDVRECHEPSCRWLFLDHSKNHSRRWCAMELCGNRAKVRRFREQS